MIFSKCFGCRSGSPIAKYDVNSYADNSTMSPQQIKPETVTEFLRSQPDFLERYVMEEVEMEELEKWVIRRSQRLKRRLDEARALEVSTCRFCEKADKWGMLKNLTRKLDDHPNSGMVLWEISKSISKAVDANTFNLYLPDHGDVDRLEEYIEGIPRGITDGTERNNEMSVVSYVAKRLEIVRISNGDRDTRFPSNALAEGHLLCLPILNRRNELAGVLELKKFESESPFEELDKEIALRYVAWGGMALNYVNLYVSMSQQTDLNLFLQEVAHSIFQDMESINVLVEKIMNFAQKLVNADRASLFLVDHHKKELYATIFDVGNKLDGEDSDDSNLTSKEIRFPLGTGFAGLVATNGTVLNIPDAYADERFNKNIDQQTGYKTKTVLCMPIFIKQTIIGVVQMVNKHFGRFTKQDEDAFKMFAVYCGLALHHAQLYDQIKKSEQKYRVALEVLSYHNSCTDEEFQMALKEGIPENLVGIDDYYFNPFTLEEYDKARHAIFMFIDLFGLEKFDKNSLLRFTLTVKKNYRRVPYHNWTHGFSVANCMYTIIKHSGKVFTFSEKLALYIGALCHDLDHRGKNNKFMLDTESPLANIYSTSTMEHHHFNQTVTILQQEGHNIFSKISNEEYKTILGLLKHCILATDLALFFDNKTELAKLVEGDSFSWENNQHRSLLQAIAMTSSDLSASAKPWDIQAKTVDIIFEEFYDQGDAERAAGRVPIPMMDRNQRDQRPASQVGFLMGICSPCYTLLYKLIPGTKALLDMCHENLEKWKEIDDLDKQQT